MRSQNNQVDLYCAYFTISAVLAPSKRLSRLRRPRPALPSKISVCLPLALVPKHQLPHADVKPGSEVLRRSQSGVEGLAGLTGEICSSEDLPYSNASLCGHGHVLAWSLLWQISCTIESRARCLP